MVRELSACLQALHQAVIAAAVPLADLAMHLHKSSRCDDTLALLNFIPLLSCLVFPQRLF